MVDCNASKKQVNLYESGLQPSIPTSGGHRRRKTLVPLRNQNGLRCRRTTSRYETITSANVSIMSIQLCKIWLSVVRHCSNRRQQHQLGQVSSGIVHSSKRIAEKARTKTTTAKCNDNCAGGDFDGMRSSFFVQGNGLASRPHPRYPKCVLLKTDRATLCTDATFPPFSRWGCRLPFPA
jgi:hypothetical protein